MLLKIFFLVCLAAEIYSDNIDKKQPVLGKKPLIRIIGGHNAHPEQFPYVVSLQLRTPRGSTYTEKHVCDGSIINEHWILTAAHCYTSLYEELVVKAGKIDLSKTENHEQVVRVKKFIKPESFKFDPDGPHNDIALAQLEKPLQLNKYVSKIALPSKNSRPKGLATLSGWGTTSPEKGAKVEPLMQSLRMPIIALKTCKKLTKKLDPKVKLINSQMCTLGSPKGGLGGCAGDSGSPLVVTNKEGHPEVVGIYSWSFEPCAAEGSPDMFTRVSAYIKWIEKAMRTS